MFTEICTISKEFCKALKKEEIAECRGKRGPQRKLQLEELITLNYMRFAFHIKDMKGIYNLAKELGIVKKLPSYANFIKGSNRIVPIISKFLNYLLMKNRLQNQSKVHYIDSTPLSICYYRNSYRCKVAKEFAKFGKSTKGWFYGFKLHGVCSPDGKLESILITNANVHDSSVVDEITKGLEGRFFADAGYRKKKSDLSKLAESGRILCAATRKNMKCIISIEQCNLLRKRNIIEVDWNVLKRDFIVEFHQARSFLGLFRHYICSIFAYVLQHSS